MINGDLPYDPVLKPDTASSLVRHLESTLPEGEDLTVGQFLPLLGVHGFVFFILVLGLLNIAIFMLPGLSIVFGIPMVILAVQMLLGLQAPIFPAYVRRHPIQGSVLRKGLQMAAFALEKIEPAIKPRLCYLTHPRIIRFHSVVALLLAFMVAIPIPFINIPPTIGIILLSIGLMQRDGVFIIGAYVFGGWSFWLYESLGRAAQNLVGG
ncbi:MAG: exopolysaccharide biosynthesis protein [Alphaproteobacteria bacterium]|nr:exopolysaccharide biosynthesis protein [Alphaproteobacteria bacterium]